MHAEAVLGGNYRRESGPECGSLARPLSFPSLAHLSLARLRLPFLYTLLILYCLYFAFDSRQNEITDYGPTDRSRWEVKYQDYARCNYGNIGVH